MSSSASVVPNVNYHLPKQLSGNFNRIDPSQSEAALPNFNFKRNLSDNPTHIGPRESFVSTSVNNDSGSIPTSKLISCNLDNAIRNSLKSVPSVPLTSLRPVEDSNKLLQRTLTFHESSSPTLDSVIKQRIQALPRSLILTTSHENVSSNNSGDKNQKSLCSDDELNHWCRSGPQNVPYKALGFGNSGNTCYLNSVLQCILATGPLLAYINAKHSSPSECAVHNGQSNLPNVNKSRFCGLCGLRRLITEHSQRAQNGTNRPDVFACGHTVPSYFVANVRAICPSLRPYQQEDAHEFLLGLLSRMEDSSMAALGKIPRRVAETNVIRRIFGGTMRSEVTCRSCQKVSARDEQWFNLSMDITCARSLQQCLCNYIKSEELQGQNAYKCENCRQLRPAMRRCTVFHAPPILIIQFNRFSRSQKLDMRVEFPSSFNLRPFMTQSKGPPVMYRLYATVNHEGFSCRSGHYVSFTCRHGQWLSHNDSFVASTNADHVLRQAPYLLFYEAVQPTIKQENGKTNNFHQSNASVRPPSSKDVTSSIQNSSTIVGPIHNPRQLSSSENVSLLPHPILVNQVKKVAPSLDSSTSLPKTLGLSSRPTSNSPNSSSVSRTIFNPNVGADRPSNLSGQISKPLSDAIPNNVKPVETITKSFNAPSVVTKPNSQLSAPTVRQLLYGTEPTPGLWTERSVSSNSDSHETPSHNAISNGVTNHSMLGHSTYSSVKNPTFKEQSPNHMRTANVESKVNASGEQPKNRLVDYTSETSDSETEYVSPAKRARTSDSSSDSSIVWVPASHNLVSKTTTTTTTTTAKPTSPSNDSDDWKRRKRHRNKKKRRSQYHNHSLSSNDSYSHNREYRPRHRSHHHHHGHKHKHGHDFSHKKYQYS